MSTTPTPTGPRWRAPLVWRVLQLLARIVTGLLARLEVTGDVPDRLRHGPLILAVNHIGTFDPIAFSAATLKIGVRPRIMATGGLFRAPIAGAAMRASGHIRVNRTRVSADEALASAAVDDAVAALAEGSVVAGYPEGRITLDPGLWPERGRSGMARLALATRVTVVPVAQWGSHEVLPYADIPANLARAVWRDFRKRPTVKVHFGKPIDLSDLDPAVRGDVQRATDRIIAALHAELIPLRVNEPDRPAYTDPTRRSETRRSFNPDSRTPAVLDVGGDDLPGAGQSQQRP
ncbi:MAG: 1-acyl-sn-glycerol-3-phosphate acyltransferase [Hamadaea sp.]|uniref:lysophospholipid acyltransferase family protein n=1 Tax=Hamadaea sp. NPDC050747 TaxID=3155789 RepID=UPI0018397640|nr:1-acyl-sn-glycerol-3-phosphate acyltransferase [Hamadaea sp.]NUR52803.1 1-acyl-sn-glycerol-3-phosphate acyltransferase [Hamadaea sp.]NUT02289.1 1-acyl-sn-glycerol-3-phosphate acyltransferase [Hamadaea sp.]